MPLRAIAKCCLALPKCGPRVDLSTICAIVQTIVLNTEPATLALHRKDPMSSQSLPGRRLTSQEVVLVRQSIEDHGEIPSAKRLGVSPTTQARALAALPIETATVTKLRAALSEAL